MDKNQNLFDEFCDSLLVQDEVPAELVAINRKIEKAKLALEDFERMYADVKESYDIAVESNTFTISEESYMNALAELSDKVDVVRTVIADLEAERSAIAAEAMNKDIHIAQLNKLDRLDKIEKAKKIADVENIWTAIKRLYAKIKNAFGSNYSNPECKESMKKFNRYLADANSAYESGNITKLNSSKNLFERLLKNTEILIESKKSTPAVSGYISAEDIDEIMNIALEAKSEEKNAEGAEEITDSDENLTKDDNESEDNEESKKDKKLDKEFDYIAKAKEAITKLKDDTLKLVDNKESKLADSDETGKKRCMKIRETLNKLWGKDGSDISDSDVLDSIKKKIGKIYVTLTPAMEEIYNDEEIQSQVALMESLLVLEEDNAEAFDYAMESICDYVDNKIWLQRMNELYDCSFSEGTAATESLSEDIVFDDIDKGNHNLDLVTRMAEASIDRLNTFGDDDQAVQLRRKCTELIAECLRLEKLPSDDESVNILERSKELLEKIKSVDNEIADMTIIVSDDEPEVNLPAEESVADNTSKHYAIEGLHDYIKDMCIMVALESLEIYYGDEMYYIAMEGKQYDDLQAEFDRAKEKQRNAIKFYETEIVGGSSKAAQKFVGKRDEITGEKDLQQAANLLAQMRSNPKEANVLASQVASAIRLANSKMDNMQKGAAKKIDKAERRTDLFKTITRGIDRYNRAQKFNNAKRDYSETKDDIKDLDAKIAAETDPIKKQQLEDDKHDLELDLKKIDRKIDGMKKGRGIGRAWHEMRARQLSKSSNARKLEKAEQHRQSIANIDASYEDKLRSDAKDLKRIDDTSDLKQKIANEKRKLSSTSDPTKRAAIKKNIESLEEELIKVRHGINGKTQKELDDRIAAHQQQTDKNLDVKTDAEQAEFDRKEAEKNRQSNEAKKKNEREAAHIDIANVKDQLKAMGQTKKDALIAKQRIDEINEKLKDTSLDPSERDRLKKELESATKEMRDKIAQRKADLAKVNQLKDDLKKASNLSDEDRKRILDEEAEEIKSNVEKDESDYRERVRKGNIKKAQDVVDETQQKLGDARKDLSKLMKSNAPESDIEAAKKKIKDLEDKLAVDKDEVSYASGEKERPKPEEVNNRTGLKPSEEDLVYKIFKRSINDITVSLEKDIDGYRKQVEGFVDKQKKRLTELTPDSEMYNECKTGIDLAEKLLKATSSTHSDYKASSKYGSTPEEQAKMEEERLSKDRQQREALRIKKENEQKTEEANKKAQYQATVDSNFEKVREVGTKLINSFGAYDQANSELIRANKSNAKNKQQLISTAQSKFDTVKNAIKKAYNALVNAYGDYRTAINDYNSNTGSKMSATKLKMTKDLSKDLALYLENVMIGSGKTQHSMRDGLDKMITFTDSALAGYTNIDFTEEEFEIWCAAEGFDLSNLEEYNDFEFEKLTKAIACRLSDAYIASESNVSFTPATEAKDSEPKQKKTIDQMNKIKKALEELRKSCKKAKGEKSTAEFKIQNILRLLDKENLKVYEIGAKYIKKRAELKKLRYGLAHRYGNKIMDVCKEVDSMWDKEVWSSTETYAVLMKKIAFLSSKLTRAHNNFMRKAEKELKKFEDVKKVTKLLHAQKIEVDRAHGEALHMNKQYIGRGPHVAYNSTESWSEFSLFSDMEEAFESSVEMQLLEDIPYLPEFILEDEELAAMAYESLYEIISEEIENE